MTWDGIKSLPVSDGAVETPLRGQGGTLGTPRRGPNGLVEPRAEWMQRGACVGSDVDLFFIAPGEYPWEAIAMCSRCTVRQECLDYAISNDIKEGIWGGVVPKQRRGRLLRGTP